MKDAWAIAIEFALAWALGFLLVACVLFALSGCVTRTTVCLETAHGMGPRDPVDGFRPATLGASVCAEIERP